MRSSAGSIRRRTCGRPSGRRCAGSEFHRPARSRLEHRSRASSPKAISSARSMARGNSAGVCLRSRACFEECVEHERACVRRAHGVRRSGAHGRITGSMSAPNQARRPLTWQERRPDGGGRGDTTRQPSDRGSLHRRQRRQDGSLHEGRSAKAGRRSVRESAATKRQMLIELRSRHRM